MSTFGQTQPSGEEPQRGWCWNAASAAFWRSDSEVDNTPGCRVEIRGCGFGFDGKHVGGLDREAGPTAAEENTSKGKNQEGMGSPVGGNNGRWNTDFQREQTFEAEGYRFLRDFWIGNGRGGSSLVTGSDLWEEQNPEGRSS